MKSTLVIFLALFSSTWASPRERIIGGSTAVAGQFGFAAAINVATADGNYFCGGTLINRQFVLTAAQCVDGATLFTIILGSNSLTASDPNRLTVATSEYIIHPEYNPLTLENDIALIQLRINVELSDYLKPVDYLPAVGIYDNTILTAIGWGQTSDQDAELSDELHYVRVSAIPNAQCSNVFGNQITNNTVCVDGNFNEGACHGDSGGALLQDLGQGRMMIVGVSSFVSGNGCESPDPSGYTRTFPHTPWIKATANIP